MISWFSDSVLLYVVEWLIRLAMLLVVPFRRSPAAARSWLLLIFFLPIPGLLLFLLIGSPRFPAWRVERFRKMRGFLTDLGARLRSEGAVPKAECDVTALAERLGYLPAVGGNAIELLDDYEAVIDRLVADIDGAKASV